MCVYVYEAVGNGFSFEWIKHKQWGKLWEIRQKLLEETNKNNDDWNSANDGDDCVIIISQAVFIQKIKKFPPNKIRNKNSC